MRIHPIRLGVVGAVIASGSFLFAMSAGASTSASPANITQFQQKLEQQTSVVESDELAPQGILRQCAG